MVGIKEMQQYQEEKTVIRAILFMYRAEYAEAVKLNREARIDYVEFKASELQSYIKGVLYDWGELDEKLFPKEWDSRRIGRVLTRIGIFKKTRSGRSLYIVTAVALRELCKRFFGGGLGGLGGLKTRTINIENNPPNMQAEVERSPNQASLTSYTAAGGLSSEVMTFEINPPNPPNPPSLLDVIGKVRLAFQGGSLEEFLKAAASLGLSRGEADSLLKLLFREGRLALDPEGSLRWVEGA
ncbi:MAG: hypothetical protein QXV74_03880 [Candidatus Bathyarchaeia archaeon]